MVYTHIDVVPGTPRTGEAEQWNLMGHAIEDLEAQVYRPVMASMSRSTVFTSNGWTRVNYDTVDYQSQPGMVDLVNDRITIPVDGIWLVQMNYAHGGDSNGARGGAVGVNDTTSPVNTPLYTFLDAPDVGACGVNAGGPIPLNQGDQVNGWVGSFTSASGLYSRASYPNVTPRLSVLLLVRL